MKSVFTQHFSVEPVYLDCLGKAKPSALLYFAQEAAGGHCKELSLDWDTLSKRNLFWAVIRHKMEILRLPEGGETITVETWPMPTTRSAFPRATAGYDKNGNLLFRCISLWVLMDTNTRSMVVPGKSNIDLTGTVRGGELAPPPSILPKPMDQTVVRRVGYTELDRNGHMNNARYLDWIDDLLPSAFHREHPLRELTICYLSEVREGEEIHLRWQLSDGPVLQADGHRTEPDVPGKQTRTFSVQARF